MAAKRDKSLARKFIAENPRCAICGSETNVQAHHKIPLAQGGEDTYDNLMPLCYECHYARHRATDKKLNTRIGIAKKMFGDNKENVRHISLTELEYIAGERGAVFAHEIFDIIDEMPDIKESRPYWQIYVDHYDYIKNEIKPYIQRENLEKRKMEAKAKKNGGETLSA